MTKERLYIFTWLGVSLVVILVSALSFNYLYKVGKAGILHAHVESSHREAREIGRMLEQQLKSGLTEEEVKNNLQQSIENTDIQSGFICMYDTGGVELCHPDPGRIGAVVSAGSSEVKDLNSSYLVDFVDLLNAGNAGGGLRSYKSGYSEIIYVYPVKDTDWMVAGHANILVVKQQLSDLYLHFSIIYIITAIIIIVSSVFTIRYISKKYEKALEHKRSVLEEDVKALTVLNNDLIKQQEVLSKRANTLTTIANKEHKRRVMTYYKDEIVAVGVEQISFVFTQASLTHIVTNAGKLLHSNSTLDEVMTDLPEREFFRANRQYIIAVKFIAKIYRHGKNQLKIVMTPTDHDEIIISKNKVAEFKQWLNS